MSPRDDGSDSPATRPPAESVGGVEAVISALTGDLPCIGCRYNLRGLSIREACPECALPVRATLLAVVDPRADELAPIRFPILIAWSVVLWASAAAVAAMAVWALRLGDLVAASGFAQRWPFATLSSAAVVAAAASAVGSLALVRPHRGLQPRSIARAAFGVACYIPAVAALAYILLRHDVAFGPPGLFTTDVDIARTQARLVVWIAAVGIVLGLRPHLRLLRARSLVMRTGRTETQPASALVAAVGLAAVGDLLNLLCGRLGGLAADVTAVFAAVAVAAGAFFTTLGLIALSADAWRIRSAIVRPALGLADVFEERPRT